MNVHSIGNFFSFAFNISNTGRKKEKERNRVRGRAKRFTIPERGSVYVDANETTEKLMNSIVNSFLRNLKYLDLIFT